MMFNLYLKPEIWRHKLERQITHLENKLLSYHLIGKPCNSCYWSYSWDPHDIGLIASRNSS